MKMPGNPLEKTSELSFAKELGALEGLCYMPDAILVEGVVVQRDYQAFGVRNVFILGDLKSKQLSVRTSKKRSGTNKRVLILGDMHNFFPLWDSSVVLAKRNPEICFVFRAHPANLSVARYLWTRAQNQQLANFELSDSNDLSLELQSEFDCALLDATGSAVEVARAGVPAFAFVPEFSFGLGPLWSGLRLGPVFDGTDRSFVEILTFLHSRENSRLVEDLQQIANETSCVSDTLKLDNLLKALPRELVDHD